MQPVGRITSTLGTLTELRRLNLSGFMMGRIPITLGRLVQLELLGLTGSWRCHERCWTALSGPIPASLGNLTKLRALHLSRNYLSGPIPSEFGNLANLRVMDPDGDPLSYGGESLTAEVATVSLPGSTMTVQATGPGTAVVLASATDTGGSNGTARHTFLVTVARPFSDSVIVPGETPVKALHFTELRERIDGVRAAAGLGPYAWTDRALSAGVTEIRLVHLLELRSAVEAAYRAAGRPVRVWTDSAPRAGATPVRAAHLMELRAAVVALE